MTNLLCIDTSSTLSGGVALIRDNPENLLAEIFLPNGKTQGEFLAPAIAKVLQENQMSVKDLSAIAVANGPGSFTGIRIGLATAQGLALPYSTPLIGISSLAALAMNARAWVKSKGANARVCTLLDARKQEIYAACFHFNHDLPEAVIDERHCRPEVWARLLSNKFPKNEPLLLFGEGCRVYQKILSENLSGRNAEFWSAAEQIRPAARNLAFLAWEKLQKRQFDSPEALLPRYLRPVAEEFRPGP